MLTLIKGGFVLDPASHLEGLFDILIKDKRIHRVDKEISISQIQEVAKNSGMELRVVDAKGKYVMPGFIDLHVHLREPGYEYKETIATGTKAAAAGGYTSICPMPNTKPAIDNKERAEHFLEKAKKDGLVHVLPLAAITLEQMGQELVDIEELKNAGIVALSEDGKSLMDTALYAQAMRQAAKLNLPIFAHCEDKSLVGNGVINQGKKSEELKLPGISNAVEDIITARDILLAKDTGAQLHICHISTKDSARLLGAAKQEGLAVTGEVCPHHFILSDEDIPSDDSNYKMNPPLRSKADVDFLKEALRDGIIDVIATDHAPHSEEEKSKSFIGSPFGIVGSETAFALSYTELVKTGYLTLTQLVEKMSVNPAKILGIDKGCIGEGRIADLTIVDLGATYSIDKNKFFSKSKNTPFHGRQVTGRVELTFVEGELVYTFDN